MKYKNIPLHTVITLEVYKFPDLKIYFVKVFVKNTLKRNSIIKKNFWDIDSHCNFPFI